MTCITGVVDAKGKVWMGGDSCYTSGQDITLNGRPKVYRKIGSDGVVWLIGCSGFGRFGQIVRYSAPFPEPPLEDRDIEEYLVHEWIPMLRQSAHNDGGTVTKDGGEITNSSLLIGIKGQLFYIDGAYHVTTVPEPYFSIGSGAPYSDGYLGALERWRPDLSPKKRIRAAIKDSSLHRTGVGGRIDIIST